MSDDEPLDGSALARVYDYLKHLTTLSLIAIGGVLGLLTGDGPTLKPLVVVVVGTLAISGVISMMTLSAITMLGVKREAEHTAKVFRALSTSVGAATFTIMLGLGMFLGAFVQALNR